MAINLKGFSVTGDGSMKMVQLVYSTIDENGNVVSSNIRKSFAAVDQELLNAIAVIETAARNRIGG